MSETRRRLCVLEKKYADGAEWIPVDVGIKYKDTKPFRNGYGDQYRVVVYVPEE